jgi:hypothetical protein
MLPRRGFAEYPSTNLAAFPNHPSTRILPHATRRHGFYHKPPGDFLLLGADRVGAPNPRPARSIGSEPPACGIPGPRTAVLRVCAAATFEPSQGMNFKSLIEFQRHKYPNIGEPSQTGLLDQIEPTVRKHINAARDAGLGDFDGPASFDTIARRIQFAAVLWKLWDKFEVGQPQVFTLRQQPNDRRLFLSSGRHLLVPACLVA